MELDLDMDWKELSGYARTSNADSIAENWMSLGYRYVGMSMVGWGT